MKKIVILITFQLLLGKVVCAANDTVNVNAILYYAEQSYSFMINNLNGNNHYPRSLKIDNSVKVVNESDWTSGFFPGSLWYLYENTGNSFYSTEAFNRTAPIESQKYNTSTHDLGFMLYCSFGNGLRLIEPDNYSSILIDAANSLLSRYNPVVGCIRSWDFGSWQFPVIIDNMMNLELLFWATRQTGDSSYYKAAVSHALKTKENHFRSDYSSYHVVDYNPVTGEVISKTTHQGYNDESDWARGQAWGLYGFTMCYRETGDTTFLHQAEKIADFFISYPTMPGDKIPYWDFKAPNIPNEPRDASSAAIAASALLELSSLSEDGDQYFEYAQEILINLSEKEYMPANSDLIKGFILNHGTGNKPANSEVDTPLNYGDYYFLEAVTRYRNLSNINFKPKIVSERYVLTEPNVAVSDLIQMYDVDPPDVITLSFEDKPEWVSADITGEHYVLLTLTPGADVSGTFDFTVFINDSNGNSYSVKKTVYVEQPLLPGITVTSDNSEDNHPPHYTIDADFNTFWKTGENGSWIKYDFLRDYQLYSVKVSFAEGDKYSYRFEIYTSLDGVIWSLEKEGYSSGITDGFEVYNTNLSTFARYVRINGYGSGNNNGLSINEVRFSGLDNTGITSQSKGVFSISLTASNLIVTNNKNQLIEAVEVFDLNGRNILHCELSSNKNYIDIPIALKQGGYIVTVVANGSRFSRVRMIR